MDPENQPQFNPDTPISEVLKQEQAGFVPSTPPPPKIDLANAVSGAVAASISTPPANQIRMIKTFRGDAAEAAKTQHTSVAKIVIAEDVQRRERGDNIEAAPKKKFGLLLMVIGLLALGAIAIPTVQYILNQKKAAVPIATEKTIIPFDHQENLSLGSTTRDELLGELDILNAKKPVASTIEYRKISEKIQDTNGKTATQKIAPDVFATLIGPNMPSALARSFDSDYMYGIESSDKAKSFILLKTSSYQQTFANMLHWETKMVIDLNPVLNLNGDAMGHPFTDQVVVNKDVRAVTASDGTILFLYGFLDDQTLLLTTNTQTFQDINTRYVGTHFVQ